MEMNCGNWAALWHRHRIDKAFDIDTKLLGIPSVSKPLAPHFKVALCPRNDNSRRVAAFGTSAVLQARGRATLGVTHSRGMLHVLFRSA